MAFFVSIILWTWNGGKRSNTRKTERCCSSHTSIRRHKHKLFVKFDAKNIANTRCKPFQSRSHSIELMCVLRTCICTSAYTQSMTVSIIINNLMLNTWRYMCSQLSDHLSVECHRVFGEHLSSVAYPHKCETCVRVCVCARCMPVKRACAHKWCWIVSTIDTHSFPTHMS